MLDSTSVDSDENLTKRFIHTRNMQDYQSTTNYTGHNKPVENNKKTKTLAKGQSEYKRKQLLSQKDKKIQNVYRTNRD